MKDMEEGTTQATAIISTATRTIKGQIVDFIFSTINWCPILKPFYIREKGPDMKRIRWKMHQILSAEMPQKLPEKIHKIVNRFRRVTVKMDLNGIERKSPATQTLWVRVL